MRDSEREPFYDDKTPSTGCGSECVSRCTSVYTTWHSANLCPAFLVAVTYGQLVVVNWTPPCQSVHVRGTGAFEISYKNALYKFTVIIIIIIIISHT